MTQRCSLTLFALLLAGLLAACTTFQPDTPPVVVSIAVDGGQRSVSVDASATVSDALRQAGISLGELDRVNPQSFARVVHGMTITVVRVLQETVVTQETIPYERRTTLNDGLPPGESRLLQAGINGVAEVTVRITYEDGLEIDRSEIRRVLINSPQDEIVMVGTQSNLPTVTVRGTLAYISSGNAWVMKQNSANRRPLTVQGGLDGRVFRLSEDGRALLFTRVAEGFVTPTLAPTPPGSDSATAQPTPAPAISGEAFNTLWAVFDLADPEAQPVQLDLENILWADWAPGSTATVVYSTAEPRPGFPGWQANNDLWRAEVDDSGATLNRQRLLEPSSGGIYGWFGTFYEFSPEGDYLAWAQPDSVGVLIPVFGSSDENEDATPVPDAADLPVAYIRQTLLSFSPRSPYDFVWVPAISWAPDGELIAATLHGEPLGAEDPEDSPVFDIGVFPVEGGFIVPLAERVGMWGAPRFSPLLPEAESESAIRLAWLQAEEPLNSQLSRYRLVIADRDGSNRETIFPPLDQPGLAPTDLDFTWSPNGAQIALTYQGNLYLLELATGLAQQLTADGLTSSPRWTP